jgi:hypothetical protein
MSSCPFLFVSGGRARYGSGRRITHVPRRSEEQVRIGVQARGIVTPVRA